MTLRKPLLALILSLVISLSLVAFIQLERGNPSPISFKSPLAAEMPFRSPLNMWAFPTFSYYTAPFSSQFIFDDATNGAQSVLANNSTRAEVYDFIVANPGVAFRDICAGLNIAIGTAEFHLGVLKKAGLISFMRDGKFKRFFASKTFSQTEMKLLSFLRHDTARAIVKKLAAENTVNHRALASHLCITSQGLTWQMNRLKMEGIVKGSSDGIRVTYQISEAYATVLPQLLSSFETA